MLRDYQQLAVNAVIESFSEANCNPLVVAPTGAGKSHIIAGLIEQILNKWSFAKILVIAHRKELIEQNSKKLNNVEFGIFSAGLKQKVVKQVTFAGIGTVHRAIGNFYGTNIIIIDECHLVPNRADGMYKDVITALKNSNPKLRVVGLTATPYRLDSGMLVGSPDCLFSKIVYEIKYDVLLKLGLLAPIVSKSTISMANTSDLHIRGGEFITGEMEDLFLQTIEKQVAEIASFGMERKKWLIFCSSVRHTEQVVERLNALGIYAKGITQKTEKRELIIKEFKESQELRAIVNCDVLTTGFDAPNVDLLAMLRATCSTGLYVQIVGRGMRPFEGKENCLFLDFGENVERHGFVDDLIPITDKKKAKEKRMLKACKVCQSFNNLNADECKDCQNPFTAICRGCATPIPLKIWRTNEKCPACNHLTTTRHVANATSSNLSAMRSEQENKPVTCTVLNTFSTIHKKAGKPDSICIKYSINPEGGLSQARSFSVSNFLCLEHGGFATKKATQYIFKACPVFNRPEVAKIKSVHAMYENLHLLKNVKAVTIKKNQQSGFYDILDYEFETDTEYSERREQEIEREQRFKNEPETIEFDDADLPF